MSQSQSSAHHRFLLSHLVAEGAERNPSGTAVFCDGERLSWPEFDDQVGRLAAALTELGVGRGDRVGIYLHKSIESVVSVHGILRSGAAYVPIDPLAPTTLINRLLEDCEINVIVTHEPRRAGLIRALNDTGPGAGPRAVVGLEPGDDLLADRGSGPAAIPWGDVGTMDPAPPAGNLSDDLAYVMYTSGSTGIPKGIMHTHFSGLSYARMSVAMFGLRPEDRMANFSPLHFDMSLFEIMAGVMAGATVVVIPEPYLRVPASLTGYLATAGVTTMYAVPSLYQQMETRGGLGTRDWSAVRWVVYAGEVYPPDPLRRLIKSFPNARFSNVYGPAETNVITSYDFDESSFGDDPVAIGFPCPDTDLALVDLDDDRVLTDAGESGPSGRGELIVRSATMMAGYWARPDLDRRAFLTRTGPDGLPRRWYRTGDIVSRNDAGEMIFHGRRDHQIKIRGNRVELEMVESAVAGLDGVAQAVVGVRLDDSGDSTLVVRYQPTEARTDQTGSGEDQAAWRRALSALLPSFAVPSTFEPTGTFPLTPSGKIDRRTVREAIASD